MKANSRFRLRTRAELSPIQQRPSPSQPDARPIRTDVLRFEPAVDAHWPAWHRGPLDRLQPMLTRYRE